MTLPKVLQPVGEGPRVVQSFGEGPRVVALDAWDWRAELVRQERSMGWLARHTERSAGAVVRYASGSLTAPESWLRAAARALGFEVAG